MTLDEKSQAKIFVQIHTYARPDNGYGQLLTSTPAGTTFARIFNSTTPKPLGHPSEHDVFAPYHAVYAPTAPPTAHICIAYLSFF